MKKVTVRKIVTHSDNEQIDRQTDTCHATCVSLKQADDGRRRWNDLTDGDLSIQGATRKPRLVIMSKLHCCH